LRRTTITLSHFITFIRSSRGRASGFWSGLWLCLFLLVVFSCKDDAAYIGFQKDPRLSARFVDIPLNPSVLQIDGLQTTNLPNDALQRILIGRYNDPLFGNVVATAYSSLAPPVVFIKPAASATFDSLVLQLNFDYYYNGLAGTASTQKIQVFELLDTLNPYRPYAANSSIPISPTPIGEATFDISTTSFDDALVLNNDTDTTNNVTFNVKIKIPGALGPKLFSDLQNDSTLQATFYQFTGKYKGFAFKVPEGYGDKIFGINPSYRQGSPKVTDTKLSVYYTEDGLSLRADCVLAPSANYITGIPYSVVSFTRITADRSGTSMSGIVPFKDFKPSDNRYYVQAGTSLVTKLDLSNFYKYVDTLDHIVFNSAEIIVNNISSAKPPFTLTLRVLDSLNHFRHSYVDSLAIDTLRTVTDPYFLKTKSAFTVSSSAAEQTIKVITDFATDIGIDPETKVISQIGITEFCQMIYKYRKHPRRVKAISLAVEENESKKSVDGLILDSNISLRLYYTKPIVKIR
jgi:hypothetical protein